MKKEREYVILITVLVLYQVIAFVPPFEKSIVFWQAYIFSMVSVILAFIVIKHSYREEQKLESKVFRVPIIYVCLLGSLLMMGLSIVFMILGNRIPIWVESILFSIILATMVISWISNEESIEIIENVQSEGKKQIAFISLLRSQLEVIYGSCDDEIRDKVGELVEVMKYSDPVSNNALVNIESQIQINVDKLEQCIVDNKKAEIDTLVKKLKRDIEKRNVMCKMTK